MAADSENPYEPPSTDVDVPSSGASPCPQCGKLMESGYLLSSTSVSWVGDDEGFVRKNILGGKRIPAPNTLFGGRYYGLCCMDCQLYLLRER